MFFLSIALLVSWLLHSHYWIIVGDTTFFLHFCCVVRLTNYARVHCIDRHMFIVLDRLCWLKFDEDIIKNLMSTNRTRERAREKEKKKPSSKQIYSNLFHCSSPMSTRKTNGHGGDQWKSSGIRKWFKFFLIVYSSL